jgi:prepilin-type N-terminal cleavage/methylation domain-containing protein
MLSGETMSTGIRKQDRDGFTLVEIVIAILILTVAILGLASSTSQMLQPTGDAEVEFVALQQVEDRLAEISLDPRFGSLDTLYAGTDSISAVLPGAIRKTDFTRTTTAGDGGKVLDYWTVVVTVSGGRLPSAISRKLLIGPS